MSPIRLGLPVSYFRLETHLTPQNGPSLPPPTDWKSGLETCSPSMELGLPIVSVQFGKSCLLHQIWRGILMVPIGLGLLVSPISLGKSLSPRQTRGEDSSTLAKICRSFFHPWRSHTYFTQRETEAQSSEAAPPWPAEMLRSPFCPPPYLSPTPTPCALGNSPGTRSRGILPDCSCVLAAGGSGLKSLARLGPQGGEGGKSGGLAQQGTPQRSRPQDWEGERWAGLYPVLTKGRWGVGSNLPASVPDCVALDKETSCLSNPQFPRLSGVESMDV